MFSRVAVAGKIAAHRCDSCQGSIFALVINEGPIPLVTPCKNPECVGTAIIATGIPMPDWRMVCWEWYIPDFSERQRLKVQDIEQYLAVESGELAIRQRNIPMAKGYHVISGQ